MPPQARHMPRLRSLNPTVYTCRPASGLKDSGESPVRWYPGSTVRGEAGVTVRAPRGKTANLFVLRTKEGRDYKSKSIGNGRKSVGRLLACEN